MKNLLVSKLKVILSLIYILSFYLSFSQPFSKMPIFKVSSLPVSSGYSKDSLNRELFAANSKDDVMRIIKKHRQLANVPIIIKIKKSQTQISWWKIDPSQSQKEGDYTIFQSKATEAGRFYKYRELQQYFKDTIVVFDTLKIGMYLQDANFRIEDYFFKIPQKDNVRNMAIPYDKHNDLLLTDSLFGRKLWVSGDLYNSEDTSEVIVRMNLYFPDEQTKASLIDIAQDLKMDMPDVGNKDLAGFISSYIRNNYGSVSFKEVVDFLQKNIQ